jgi:hypothetical protein
MRRSNAEVSTLGLRVIRTLERLDVYLDAPGNDGSPDDRILDYAQFAQEQGLPEARLLEAARLNLAYLQMTGIEPGA